MLQNKIRNVLDMTWMNSVEKAIMSFDYETICLLFILCHQIKYYNDYTSFFFIIYYLLFLLQNQNIEFARFLCSVGFLQQKKKQLQINKHKF